jgi:hypothetical protein
VPPLGVEHFSGFGLGDRLPALPAESNDGCAHEHPRLTKPSDARMRAVGNQCRALQRLAGTEANLRGNLVPDEADRFRRRQAATGVRASAGAVKASPKL